MAFIPYITAGDPDLSTTAKALKVLDSCGSDIIELGLPYSDPLADGPVIQVWQFGCLLLLGSRYIHFYIYTSPMLDASSYFDLPIKKIKKLKNLLILICRLLQHAHWQGGRILMRSFQC